MSNTGRKKDLIWLSFDVIKNKSRTGIRAKCKSCGKELEGQVARMRNHLSKSKCGMMQADAEDDPGSSVSQMSSTISVASSSTSGSNTENINKDTSAGFSSKRKKVCSTLDSYIVRCPPYKKKTLDEQVARFIYATNTSFRSVEHPQFLKLVEQLHPGYVPPSRKEISGDLLNSIYEIEKQNCALILKDEIVCLGFDGWSNVHNEPIICITVATKTGHVFLVDTIDTSGKAHTAVNLKEMALASIMKCQSELQCQVRSVVTDNTGNVTKMRKLLNEDKNIDIISYGCTAHMLNLLVQDIHYPTVKEQLLKIIKYFRNNHFANACYTSHPAASKLILPNDTRWNTMSDALEIYIKHWPILVKICEENREAIDLNIQHLVSNIALKRNAENMFQQLKPIAIALDKIQRDDCNIADAVHIWKFLGKTFREKKVNKEVLSHFNNRYEKALTPAHFLSYMLNPKIEEGLELTEQEKKDAFDFVKEKYSANSLMPLIIKFHAKSSPFQQSFFEPEIVNNVTIYEWWKSQQSDIDKFNDNVFKEIEQLLTAKASSASVERIFSTFGLVQSKLRNKLGLEKASKLVFLFKMFN